MVKIAWSLFCGECRRSRGWSGTALSAGPTGCYCLPVRWLSHWLREALHFPPAICPSLSAPSLSFLMGTLALGCGKLIVKSCQLVQNLDGRLEAVGFAVGGWEVEVDEGRRGGEEAVGLGEWEWQACREDQWLREQKGSQCRFDSNPSSSTEWMWVYLTELGFVDGDWS